jgi:hypothetical protein
MSYCLAVSLLVPFFGGQSSCPTVCPVSFPVPCLEVSLLLSLPEGRLPVSLCGGQHRHSNVWRPKPSFCLPVQLSHFLEVRLYVPYSAADLPVSMFSKPNQTS